MGFTVEIKQEENSGDKCGNNHSNIKWYAIWDGKMFPPPLIFPLSGDFLNALYLGIIK